MRAQNLPSAPPRILHFEARVIRFEARVILPLVIPSQHFLTEALSYRGQCLIEDSALSTGIRELVPTQSTSRVVGSSGGIRRKSLPLNVRNSSAEAFSAQRTCNTS